MWPFSTLKRLRWEIEQANTANGIMRTALTRRDERIAILDKQIAHRDSYIKALQADVEHGNTVARGQSAIIANKDGAIRQLNGTISGLHGMNKGLAAERDEAVLRARNVETNQGALVRMFNEEADEHRAIIVALRAQLATALVRDPKTGRLGKWQEQPPGEAPFDFLGNGCNSAKGDTVNFDRVMAGLHDTVRK